MGKEVEFKIPMTKEEAERVLNKVFNDEYHYSTKIKTDKYWASVDGKTKEEGKVFRLRSEHFVTDKELLYFSKVKEINVIDWFFYNTEKMFESDEIEKWEDKEGRSEFDNIWLTYKQKKIENSVENNVEEEERINASTFALLDKMFNNLGKRYFNKIKRCISVDVDPINFPDSEYKNLGITIDIDNVHDLFYFEIEGVCDEYTNVSRDEIYKALEEITRTFGLNPDNKDSRSWVEILGVQ